MFCFFKHNIFNLSINFSIGECIMRIIFASTISWHLLRDISGTVFASKYYSLGWRYRIIRSACINHQWSRKENGKLNSGCAYPDRPEGIRWWIHNERILVTIKNCKDLRIEATIAARTGPFLSGSSQKATKQNSFKAETTKSPAIHHISIYRNGFIELS